LGEEGDGGVELEVIGVAEDLLDGAILDGVDEVGAACEARSEGGVGEVGAGFGEVGDAEALGHGGGAEAPDLGEDEPHPVGTFLAGGELGVGLGVGGGLRVEEALEVEGVGGHVVRSRFLSSSVASQLCLGRRLWSCLGADSFGCGGIGARHTGVCLCADGSGCRIKLNAGWGRAVCGGVGSAEARRRMEMTANADLLAREAGRVREEQSAEREAEFAGLVGRQARLIFRVAMSLVRNEADAEDAVQEAFLKLYRTGAWLGVREERAFVGRVVWRCALDRLERSRRARETSMRTESGVEMEWAATGASVEERMSGERATLRRLIDSLPEELRRPLVLSAIEEMTSAEVGVVIGIPEGTVRTRLMRARSELRKRFAVMREGRRR